MNFKNIHIGDLINQRVKEMGVEIFRICNFFKCTEKEIDKMYSAKSMDSEILLKWSKLLEYDFFRIYSQHIILYAPPSARRAQSKTRKGLPEFRKNIYTKEIIDFMIELFEKNEKTKAEIIEEYRIPKTTLHNWISKYQKDK